MNSAPILVFGSVNRDQLFRVDRFVAPGESKVATEFRAGLGGKGFNQAIAARRAGASVRFAGCIGQGDEIEIEETLDREGIEHDQLRGVATPTGHAIIQVDTKGENAILVHPGANRAVTPEHIRTTLSATESGSWIVLQNEVSNLSLLLETAAERGLRLICNPAPADTSTVQLPWQRAEIIVVNESEACLLAGTDSLSVARQRLIETYPQSCVIITLGAQGLILAQRGQPFRHLPAQPVESIDSVGAGDTFVGHLAARLQAGECLAKAAQWASTAAALSTTRSGASESIPHLAEVKHFLTTHRSPDFTDILPTEVEFQNRLRS